MPVCGISVVAFVVNTNFPGLIKSYPNFSSSLHFAARISDTAIFFASEFKGGWQALCLTAWPSHQQFMWPVVLYSWLWVGYGAKPDMKAGGDLNPNLLNDSPAYQPLDYCAPYSVKYP